MTGRARVSGHYAGAFSRLLAFLIDWFVILGSYAVGLGIGRFVVETFLDVQVELSEGEVWWVLGWAVWGFVYLTTGLAVSGRAIGKALLGLRVVTRRGAPLTIGRAALRTLVMPLSFALLGLGLLGVVLGRERRALHDVIAGSAVVYDWGDRPAELPSPLTRFLQRRGALPPAPAEAATPAVLASGPDDD